MATSRILVPVDYSECSKEALRAAAALAMRLGATLDVVHVWDRPQYVSEELTIRQGNQRRSIADMIRENAEQDMETFVTTAEVPPGVAMTRRLKSGQPVATVLGELEEGKHDLVVLGTHGRTGLSHVMLGSFAEKLVRLSPVPALTVPQTTDESAAPARAVGRILVATDFSEPSRAALDYAANLAKKLEASVDLLHVWEAPTFVVPGTGMTSIYVGSGAGEQTIEEVMRQSANHAMDEFVAKAKARGVAVRSMKTEQGRPAHAIVEAAKSGEYDLIVIGTHGRTGLPRVLLGSVAENVVRHARCPVLTVRTHTSE